MTWVILSEIFPTRIRGRAMAIATVCLWIANYVVTQTFVMMDEMPAAGGEVPPRPSLLAICRLLRGAGRVVWCWVPETKGKSLEEIERGWLQSA